MWKTDTRSLPLPTITICDIGDAGGRSLKTCSLLAASSLSASTTLMCQTAGVLQNVASVVTKSVIKKPKQTGNTSIYYRRQL